MDEHTLNVIKTGACIGIAAGIIHNSIKPSKSELIQQEIDARALKDMPYHELIREQSKLKVEEEATGLICFWVLMIVGMFIFPFIFVPICAIGASYAIIKRYGWKNIAIFFTVFGILIGYATNEYWMPKDVKAERAALELSVKQEHRACMESFDYKKDPQYAWAGCKWIFNKL